MDTPREISGSPGSRIRLIFGSTGNEWVLLLDEDDGDSQWQTHNWSAIPHKVANQLNNCTKKGRRVEEIDIGPTGAWFISGVKWDGTGRHSWWGDTNYTNMKHWIEEGARQNQRQKVSFGSCPHGSETYAMISGYNGYATSGFDYELDKRMRRINSSREDIHFVRLFHNNAYFISDHEGMEWKHLGEHCSKELKKNIPIDDLAVAGDGNWVIIRSNHFVASTGVDRTLTSHLANFFTEQKERINQRSREIEEYTERIAREARESSEAAERAEREEEEMRRASEIAEREARESAERAAREAAERQQQEQLELKLNSERLAELERALEKRLLDEAKSIEELEAHLRKRKNSLEDAISSLPPERRVCIRSSVLTEKKSETKSERVECVVCRDRSAVRAVIPCGHHCLCDECADRLVSDEPEVQCCPLCRRHIESTLKIYRH